MPLRTGGLHGPATPGIAWFLPVLLVSSEVPATQGPPADLPVAQFNDNLKGAGRLLAGVLRIELELRWVDWRPLGPDHGGGRVMAFGEAGRPAQVPGPMIRVRAGTVIQATVTNRLDTVMVVHGLSARRGPVMDSLVLAPGASRRVRFLADVEPFVAILTNQ